MTVARVRAEEVAVLAAASPLAKDLALVAGPFTVPAALLAGTDRIGPDDTGTRDALRAFLDEDPWAGMASVRPDGWMFLARDESTLVIGRREGPVGIGEVVTLRRENCRFRAEAMAGARLTTGVVGEAVEAVYGATADGDAVTLEWDSGADHTVAPLRRIAEVRVHADPHDVHVLLVSEPDHDLVRAVGWQAGTGRSATTTLRLDAPLGDRRLLSAHRVPAETVVLSNGRG